MDNRKSKIGAYLEQVREEAERIDIEDNELRIKLKATTELCREILIKVAGMDVEEAEAFIRQALDYEIVAVFRKEYFNAVLGEHMTEKEIADEIAIRLFENVVNRIKDKSGDS